MEFVKLFCCFLLDLYAFIAGGDKWVKSILGKQYHPSLTALGTCGSIAYHSNNLEATEKVHIPAHTSFIPLGAPLHKDGS
jgi:hypothetical protein